jgi:serine/threonine protein kinase
MVRFTCGSCQKKLSAKDEMAGKKVKCPSCHNPVAVPSLGDERRANAEEQTKSMEDHKAEPTRSYHAETPRGKLWDFLAPAKTPDEIGRLGPYRVLRVLGAGGMGVVFEAEDPKLKRKVALKAMLPALAASETARKRFLREAQTAAALEHDHIVPIFQVDEDRGVPYIAMPFLKGEPLDKRLKGTNPLPIAEVLRIGREAAKGLRAAHAAGLVHRDIKPANLWLEGEEDRVKILDFGLARAAADGAQLTQQGVIIGTPAYMAPEQAAGKTVDSRCDLFSLGCVLYRMSTGQQPFKGPDMVSTLMAVATHEPVPPVELCPELPQAFSDLVMELLAKEPEERPESAKVVADALREIEDEIAEPAAQPSRSVTKRKKARRQSSSSPIPKRSHIKEHALSDGRRFKWPLPGAGIMDYLPHLLSVCLVGYSVYQTISLFWLVRRAVSLPNALFSLGWPLIAFVSAFRFLKPSRPESITLGTDYFRHDLGRPGGFMASADTHRNLGGDSRPLWRQLLGLPLLVETSRDELGEIVIERLGNQLRIRYDFGADRIEIGRYLREPEKEWLADVIIEWQKSA